MPPLAQVTQDQLKEIARRLVDELRSHPDGSPAKAFCLRQLEGIRREAERRRR